MNLIQRFIAAGLTIACGVGLYASPAQAQATRTWVSGVGDDVNPCSRTAPCKTFAGAISKTAAGGEINCLDPGGYGAVTITKAIAIVCDHTGGTILASGTSGIIVNAGAADAVSLSGLDINGAGTGTAGVRLVAGGALHIQNSSIRMFSAPGAVAISAKHAGSSQLTVVNTTISDNANGIDASPAGGKAAVTIMGSTIVNNGGSGINASGDASIWVSNSSIVGNGTGVAAAGGARIVSYGDNRLHANGQDGAFTATAARQ